MHGEVERALAWLSPAFAWAASGWAPGQAWADARPAFLAAVGLDSADIHEPGYGLVRRFVEYVDSQLPDIDRREFLTNPSTRADVLYMFAAADYQPVEAAPEPGVL